MKLLDYYGGVKGLELAIRSEIFPVITGSGEGSGRHFYFNRESTYQRPSGRRMRDYERREHAGEWMVSVWVNDDVNSSNRPPLCTFDNNTTRLKINTNHPQIMVKVLERLAYDHLPRSTKVSLSNFDSNERVEYPF